MRNYGLWAVVGLIMVCLALAEPGGKQPRKRRGNNAAQTPLQPELNDLLESKVRAEWDAYKKKDKRAFADLVTDDFVGVESDGQGTRTKPQAMVEVERSNVANYTLFAFKVVPVGSDAAFVTYENTMEFPHWAKIRFLRVYISELWTRNGGQWKMRHSQETPVK
jgi:ketosteroid isomerase-like protein